jgi:hypothetical protein
LARPQDSTKAEGQQADRDALTRSARLLLVLAAGEKAGRPTIARDEAVRFVVLEVNKGDGLALREVLGHPPFEQRLYHALGDLVELGLVSQGVNGFGLTDPGRTEASKLEPTFGSAIENLADALRANT